VQWIGHAISLEQDCRDHLAVFGGEDVVGAAGGRGIHEFDADAGFDQFAVQLGAGELLFCAGAEQYDFGLQCQEVVEMRCAQRGEIRGRPIGAHSSGHNDERLLVASFVDGDITLTMSGE
jgi:hypothetical protein